MLDHESDTHLYLQISEILRSRLISRRAGELVPSEADVQREFGVARTTARRAIGLLRAEGLVHTVQGRGTYVGSPGEAPHARRGVPLYHYIALELAQQIRKGAYRPRRPIPAESALLHRYGCARETVRRALALLREEGWIYTVPQRGSYVSPEDAWPADR